MVGQVVRGEALGGGDIGVGFVGEVEVSEDLVGEGGFAGVLWANKEDIFCFGHFIYYLLNI